MRQFAELYRALDETNKTNEKIAALVDYFAQAPPDDAAWAVYCLSGRRPRRVVSSRELGAWAGEIVNIPEWLFTESYDAVGDIAETVSLLLPESGQQANGSLTAWIETHLLPLKDMDETGQHETITTAWNNLSTTERLVYNKLITGGFRVGVSQKLVTRALADHSGIDRAVIAHRLMGNWEPTAAFYTALMSADTEDADRSRPYPFFLAYPVDDDTDLSAQLGDRDDWQVEWKWDGIRGQVIKRDGQVYIWSRGEELVTDRYPEVAQAAQALPDGIALDGELLPWNDSGVMRFADLQRRIGRKKIGKKLLAEIPVIFLVYDLMEYNGQDIRERPLTWRRDHAEQIVQAVEHQALRLSEIVTAPTWADLRHLRETSRERNVEGLMLKRAGSPYRVGRKRGDWWKWKVEPYTADAVLIYAQRGSGKRASLYTDYTFALWTDDGDLVPFAKAYSGLTDAEIRQVDRIVRNTIREKFGPVRSVEPTLVMELAFEDIHRSSRHKSGVAVRFPRIVRWRRDKPVEEADSLTTIEALLPAEDKPE
jgi:DNA ligase 1